MAPPLPKRLFWIDALRGLAIILMIPANLSPYLAEPHPLWYRILGSYAAPIFITLSAGMVVLRSREHTPAYYWMRGGYVVLIGILIDVFLWRIYPCTSFDVLYLIGLGMIVSYYARKMSLRALLITTALVFAAAHLLQHIVGYTAAAYQIYFEEPEPLSAARLLMSWFIDGWFPIFPWIGFVFLGVGLFKVIFKSEHSGASRVPIIGVALLALGALLFFVPIPGWTNYASGGIIANRDEYSEIFYPPTISYLITAVGMFVAMSSVFRRLPPIAESGFLSFFGRYSMLVYILHQALGDRVLSPIIEAAGLEQLDSGFLFAVANIAVIAAIALLLLLVDLVKRRWRPKYIFLQVIFGR